MKPTKITAAIAVCFAAQAAANSQASDNIVNLTSPTATELEVISITANRHVNEAYPSIANQTVITASDIQALNASSLGEVLATIAGFDLSSTGGRGQTASVFLRGNNAGHTLFLLNGVKLSSATLGLTDFQKVSVANIERIEIVKGPRAALWGSEAIGGVVNIITKSGENGTEIGAKIASFNTQQLTLSTRVEHGEGQTNILLDHERSDGYHVLEFAAPDDDGFRYNSLSVNGQQTLSSSLSLNWLLNFDRGQNDYDSAFGGADQSKHNNQQLALSADYAIGAHVVSVDLSRMVEDTTTYDTVTTLASRLTTQREGVTVTDSIELDGNLELFVGAEIGKETVSGDQNFAQTERDTSALFVQSTYVVGQAQFEGAARYDDIDGVDSELTYNLGVGYAVDKNVNVTVNLGTGFKVPTFNDLYWPTDLYSMGNPNLESERSKNLEIAAYVQQDNANLKVSLFRNEIENLIEWTPNANFVYQPNNVDSATIKGFEVEFGLNLERSHHHINASFIIPTNDLTGETLTLRAKRRINYVFGFDLNEQWSTTTHASYVSEREQKAWDGNINKIGSYVQFDLNGHYQLNTNTRFSFGVKDAFEQQEPSAWGYLVPGRRLELQAKYLF